MSIGIIDFKIIFINSFNLLMVMIDFNDLYIILVGFFVDIFNVNIVKVIFW